MTPVKSLTESWCACVATGTALCRPVQRRDPQVVEEMEGKAYESLTLTSSRRHS